MIICSAFRINNIFLIFKGFITYPVSSSSSIVFESFLPSSTFYQKVTRLWSSPLIPQIKTVWSFISTSTFIFVAQHGLQRLFKQVGSIWNTSNLYLGAQTILTGIPFSLLQSLQANVWDTTSKQTMTTSSNILCNSLSSFHFEATQSELLTVSLTKHKRKDL